MKDYLWDLVTGFNIVNVTAQSSRVLSLAS